MSWRLTAEPGAWAWLDAHPEVAAAVQEWFFVLAEDPTPYVAVGFEAEPAPRQYAVVPETDIVVTFARLDDVRWINVLKLEQRPEELWTPA